MKKHLLCLLAMIAPMMMSAQDEVETTIGADIVSQYIWRGQELGDVSLQPTLGIAYKGLSITAWGSVGLSNKDNTKEFDLTAAYTTGGFHIGVTDYWFNTPNERYFAYSAHETSHVFEANVGYDFEIASLNWYTNFAGNDGVNKDGKRAYSSYFEANVPFKLAACEWTATIGAVPYATSFYSDANGFVVTNIGIKATKDIKVNDHFSIPIFAGITANPSTEKTFFIFGVSL
ncbi:MAG: hypothetical protein II422_04340 [Prevotella sp.]|nr:hypothetical protein [Prevotella sp.]